jgi:hypothetical protein
MQDPPKSGAVGKDGFECLKLAMEMVKVDGFWAEFGVYQGRTLRWIAHFIEPKRVYGFDSFEGLPEQWISGFVKGTFRLSEEEQKKIEWPVNSVICKGMFEQTLMEFLKNERGPAAFLHIDSDLYSSASTVLQTLKDRIVDGTIIVFDEYYGYPGWQTTGEAKALDEFLKATGSRAKFLCYSPMSVALVIQKTSYSDSP